MIFVISIIVIFVAVSVYFFFRAERLQRELLTVKRDFRLTKKENKILIDSVAIIAKRHEEFYKSRFDRIKQRKGGEQPQMQVISPLINNYAYIFGECMRSSGQMKVIIKKCCDGFDSNAFKEFTDYLNKQNAQIKKMWASNNVGGFISLVEALLVEQSKESST